MPVGYKRTLVGRIGAMLGAASWVIALLALLTNHTWKLSPIGWFYSGMLVTLVALFALVDGAIASQKPR